MTHKDMAIAALSTTEKDALTTLWTRSRKTVHRLALMGFVREWSQFTGLVGFKLVCTDDGAAIASAIEAQRAGITQIGPVEDESAAAKPDAQGASATHPKGDS